MSFKYRPEIDGLRAIAVISVIIYHAGFELNIGDEVYQLLPGGFLGVDIFYVISGYLISYLILEKINSNSFSFSDFYERRARRLLPTLFTVIAISIFAGSLFMMPNQFKDLSGSAISSLFFLSNFWFFITDNYFADSSLLKPLLHTWSLSIEEQFYLIFPPLIYFLYKNNLRYTKLLFFSLILGSLLFSSLGSVYFSNLNFYMLPSRIWELGVGIFLAYHHVNQKIVVKKTFNNLILFLAIAFIILPLIFFNSSTPHPSILTSFTVIGTAIIIFYNTENCIIKNILSSKLFVGTGLISYSLYLWHYPVFAFKKIKSQTLSEFDKIESIFLIITLSVISYYFIEKPFRNRKLIARKKFIIFISTFLIFLFTICLYIYKNEGLPQRYSSEITKLINFNYDYKEIYQTGKCHIEIKKLITKNFFKNCKTQINNDKKNLYLWGDSLAAHLYPGLNNKYKDNYNIWHRSADGCKPILSNSGKNKKTSPCEKINEFVINEILSINPDKIFISAFWRKEDLSEIKKIVKKLEESNITNIYLVGPSIRWHDPLPKILLKKYQISKKIPKYLSDKNHFDNFKLDEEFSNFANKNSIKYLSIIKILCKKNYTCLVKVGAEPDAITNWDENHFTKRASNYIFGKFID